MGLITHVNGELGQQGKTRELQYSIARQIEDLSTVFTLDALDSIFYSGSSIIFLNLSPSLTIM